MRFSIIVPTFNEKLVVSKTLKQYLKVKKKFDVELIVADGRSTDGTITTARQYADKVDVFSGQTETIANGRNRGAGVASGDILIFFDADVMVSDLPKLLSKVDRIFRNPKVVAATSRVKIYPEETKLFDRIFHTVFWYFIVILNFLGKGAARGECQIVRRSVFKKISGYNSTLGAGEDFELFQRLAKVGKVKSLRIPVYESPRRYRKVGYPRVLWAWFINFKSALQGKPVAKWPTVR